MRITAYKPLFFVCLCSMLFSFEFSANAQNETQSGSADAAAKQDESSDTADRQFSGPQVGEKMPSIKLEKVIGENAGDAYEMEFAGKDTKVLIFLHERTRIAFGLANAVMKMVADHPDKVSGTICVLSNDSPETRDWINRVKNNFPKKIDVAVSPDGVEGPGSLGLNRHVMLTILVANNEKVDANFALTEPSLNADGQKIVDAICKSASIETVPQITKYAPQMRGEMNRGQRAAPNEELRPYLSRVIQKDASDEDVVAAAERLEKYLADKPEMQKAVGQIAKRIIDAGRLENYGTEKAQEYLKKWADEFADK
jgi:hypothetical protein